MSGLEFAGVVGVVLLIQLVMFVMFVFVMWWAARKVITGLARNTKKLLVAINEDDDDDEDTDFIPRESWDQATRRAANDPEVRGLLRGARQRGNPRQRFVEPGKLDL